MIVQLPFTQKLQTNTRFNIYLSKKEVFAIVAALRKWKHYLTGRHFVLITDQEAVSFMFNQNRKGKNKNDKIMRWRTELSCYRYDIQHGPGKYNHATDCLTRSSCSALVTRVEYQQEINNIKFSCSITSEIKLMELHNSICHPGITRIYHFIQCRNLPYSTEEVKNLINQCPVCAELKPRFSKPSEAHLIKSTQPF